MFSFLTFLITEGTNLDAQASTQYLNRQASSEVRVFASKIEIKLAFRFLRQLLSFENTCSQKPCGLLPRIQFRRN
jgi:hypothetical protein